MLFNDVIWEFHIICFDHVYPHPSTPPRPTDLHMFLFSTPPPLPFKPIQHVLGVGLALECYWFIKITPLKKMGLLSPSSNQMTSFLARSRLHAHLYSTLRFCLAWVCASLVLVSSYVPLSCCVQNTRTHCLIEATRHLLQSFTPAAEKIPDLWGKRCAIEMSHLEQSTLESLVFCA